MLTSLHTVYNKNSLETLGCYAAYRKQEDMKNVDHMMFKCDIAAVREFMFCTWPKLRMEKLFLHLITKKLTPASTRSPHWTTAKHWIPLFAPPPPAAKISEINPPLFETLPPPPSPPFTNEGDYVSLYS